MSAAPIAHAAKLPALQVNPQVTDGSITYTDFSYRPLFSNAGPSVNDINQGDLGDCYFPLDFVRDCESRSGRHRKDIINNNDGTYTVNFVKGGTKTPIRVSARFRPGRMGSWRTPAWALITRPGLRSWKKRSPSSAPMPRRMRRFFRWLDVGSLQ